MRQPRFTLVPMTTSLSGIIGHGRYVLRPRSAGESVCPRVTVRVPDRPPDRARVGHDHVIRSLVQAAQRCPPVAAASAAVPYPSPRIRCCPHGWQQYWQPGAGRAAVL